MLISQRILKLSEDKDSIKFNIFIKALKDCRPKLGCFCAQANSYEWYSSTNTPIKIKLAYMTEGDLIALSKEPLDSDILLSCFNSQ